MQPTCTEKLMGRLSIHLLRCRTSTMSVSGALPAVARFLQVLLQLSWTPVD
jgi:hypothetical protein